MFYLLLSILCSVAVNTLLRFAKGRTSSQMAMLAANYGTCALCGLAMMKGNLAESFQGEGTSYALLLSVIGGVLFFASLALLNLNIRRSGLVVSSLFHKLGVIIPTLISVVAFHEPLSGWGILGLMLALTAIVLMNVSGKAPDKTASPAETASQPSRMPQLLLMLAVSGLASSMATIFDNTALASKKELYLMMLFFFAMPCCLIALLIKKEKPALIDLLFGFGIGIPNYFCTRFLLLSFGEISSAAAYPAQSVGAIAAACLAGVVLFKEKITLRQILALLLIAASIILLNVK